MNASLKVQIAAFVLIVAIVLTPAVYLLVTGDFPGSNGFYGLQEDDSIVSFLFNIRSIFVGK